MRIYGPIQPLGGVIFPDGSQQEQASAEAVFQTITGNYTVLASDNGSTLVVDTSLGNRTISLLAVAGHQNFKLTIVKPVAANEVIIDPAGSDTIHGFSQLKLVDKSDTAHLLYYVSNQIVLTNVGDLVKFYTASGTLTNGEEIQEYLVLPIAPYLPDQYKPDLDIEGAVENMYGIDFEITPADNARRLSWAGLGLSGLFAEGDSWQATYAVINH